MTTITIGDVLKKIKDDLNWRGPLSKQLGHVVLEHAQAQYLYDWALRIINANDDFQAALLQIVNTGEKVSGAVATTGEGHARCREIASRVLLLSAIKKEGPKDFSKEP